MREISGVCKAVVIVAMTPETGVDEWEDTLTASTGALDDVSQVL